MMMARFLIDASIEDVVVATVSQIIKKRVSDLGFVGIDIEHEVCKGYDVYHVSFYGFTNGRSKKNYTFTLRESLRFRSEITNIEYLTSLDRQVSSVIKESVKSTNMKRNRTLARIVLTQDDLNEYIQYRLILLLGTLQAEKYTVSTSDLGPTNNKSKVRRCSIAIREVFDHRNLVVGVIELPFRTDDVYSMTYIDALINALDEGTKGD